jgi:pyrroloquinoline quinone (PQQ) biosynthesis protein C
MAPSSQPYDKLNDETQAARAYLLSAPIHHQVLSGKVDIAAYHAFLVNAYHHVRFTVPLMMAAASRVDPARANIADALHEYIKEEYGHEQWILDDIAASGGDTAALLRDGPEFEVDLMVAYVRDYISHISPMGFFGMVFVLEGTSVTMASATADLVQKALNLPDEAFTYLRSHGELDIEHLDFFARLINSLTPDDLVHVTHVAKRVFRLYGDVLRAIPNHEARHAAA